MSDKYILRSGAIDAIKRNAGTLYTREAEFLLQKVILLLKHAPAADVAEVVHGEWLRSDDDWNSLTTIQCSICGEEWCFETDDDVSLLNYKHCPNCGAKMDGGEDRAVS